VKSVQRGLSVLLFSGAGFFFSPSVISSLRAASFGPGGRNRRVKSLRKARVVAALLAGLYLYSFAASAQETWLAAPSSSDWNTPTNWTAPTVPTGTATFGTSNTTTLTFSQDTSVGTLQFNAAAPSYTFELSHSLTITGGGIQGATPANAPMFNSSAPGIGFHAMSTAGPAIFQLDQDQRLLRHQRRSRRRRPHQCRPQPRFQM
jgi:hypothetical protein